MKNVRSYSSIMLLGFLIAGCLLYFFIVRALVIQAYAGIAPHWFQAIVDFLYPRFVVEKQRFELDFFLNKADQIILRSSLVCLSSVAFLWFYDLKKLINNNLVRLSHHHFRLLIFLFYSGLLYFTWDWFLSFKQIVHLKPFYQGVLLFKVFHIPILSIELYYILYFIYILSILLILLSYRQFFFSIIASILFLLFQGYSQSFEKIDHGYATLSFVMMLMPALFYELQVLQKNKTEENSDFSTFTLFLIQLSIAGAYLLAGLEKLLSSGFEWASAKTFKTYIEMHDQAYGLMLAKNDVLANLLPWGALIFQLSFILVLFYKRLALLFIILGIMFHMGTKILFGIGPYFSSWIFVYIFFIDWKVFNCQWLELITHRHKNSQKGA